MLPSSQWFGFQKSLFWFWFRKLFIIWTVEMLIDIFECHFDLFYICLPHLRLTPSPDVGFFSSINTSAGSLLIQVSILFMHDMHNFFFVFPKIKFCGTWINQRFHHSFNYEYFAKYFTPSFNVLHVIHIPNCKFQEYIGQEMDSTYKQ